MKAMEIKVCKTTEWNETVLSTYTQSFNEVFGKAYTEEYFSHKYLCAGNGYSCHALLMDAEADVVGSCTVIPCRYMRNGEEIWIGLAVDVFIRGAYRTDPLMLLRMYERLKPMLTTEKVVAVIAVPNAVAYPYWKNVVKWKDVGRINYWMLSVCAGRILGRNDFVGSILNAVSMVYSRLAAALAMIGFLSIGRQTDYKYSICKDDPYYRSKFDGEEYSRYDDGLIRYVYRITDEKGIKTGYLLTAERNGKRSFKTFGKTVHAILSHDVDMVLYVDQMGFFQTLLLKVPRHFEPKLLPMTCDLISKDEKYGDMYDIRNWDFGLKNYDVR